MKSVGDGVLRLEASYGNYQGFESVTKGGNINITITYNCRWKVTASFAPLFSSELRT